MKKFSKESMQQFLLMHVEKLILGACLVATGLFVWTSMAGEKKKAKTPSSLQDKANSADRYVKQDAWGGPDGLGKVRQGKVDARERIASTPPVDGGKFKLNFSGSPAEALAPRKDPAIFAPAQLIAQRFYNAVMVVNPDPKRISSPLSKFADAPESFGSGSRGGSDRKENGSDRKENGSDRKESGSDTRLAVSGELHGDFVPLSRGSEYNLVNALTSTGIRPKELGISENTITKVVSGVCVKAVVDFRKQSAAYEIAFAESIGYNARRDRPVYQFLQVQRREVAGNGGESEWKDISENVTYIYAQSNPLNRMPFHVFGSAPEVTSHENFDPVLTQAIPAFAQYDYQKLASHPALERREFADSKAPQQARDLDDDGGWAPAPERDEAGSDADTERLRNGTETSLYEEAIVERKPGSQYRLVRFFDLSASTEKSFEYRVRVWVGDPNQLDPTEGFVKNRGQTLQAAANDDSKPSGDDGELVRWGGSGEGARGPGDRDSNGQRDGDDAPEVVINVKPTMLSPPARVRVAGGTDFDAIQDRLVEEAERLAEEARRRKAGQRVPRTEDKFQPFNVKEYSADGQLEQIDLPPSPNRYAYMMYLRYARPSAWSESVRVNEGSSAADVMAGTTVRKRLVSVGVSGRAVEFDQVEPSIRVLVSSWSRDLKARLPAEREAHIGETMNFNSPAYVTDPVTWKIKVPEIPRVEGVEKHTVPFRTNVTMVDAFFGSQQTLPIDKRLSMETATEILVMDPNGNLKISNQFSAATNYRNELALPDDSRFYGKVKKPRNNARKEGDDNNFTEDF